MICFVVSLSTPLGDSCAVFPIYNNFALLIKLCPIKRRRERFVKNNKRRQYRNLWKTKYSVNLLAPAGTVWCCRTWSTLIWVLAYYLTVSSYYVKQFADLLSNWRLFKTKRQWNLHSKQTNFTQDHVFPNVIYPLQNIGNFVQAQMC